MLAYTSRAIYTSVICTTAFFCCLLLSACASPSPTALSPTSTHTSLSTPTPIPSPTATPHPPTPEHYNSRVLLQGGGNRPDDLIFDAQGKLLFSDPYNNKISRINSDGTATVLLRGIAGPEGMVLLPGGALVVAEQHTNRILLFPAGSTTPTVLRTLPGTPGTATCKDGVDNIAFDATTNTLIIPDSPTGELYRMSIDGKTLTLLASGIVRPVGATVDAQGIIYVADECGGAVWRITPTGNTTQIKGFGMPDDVAFDGNGNLYVIDLAPAIHALIRINLATGQRTTLAQKGFIEPQGLILDQQGDIFVSDDYADTVVKYSPA